MKNLLASVLILFATITISHAQDRGRMQQRNPEDMAKMQTERLTKELNLSQSQQDSIYKYVLATATEQRKIFQENNNDRQAAMKAMQELRQKQDLKIKSFLNEEQTKKYEEIQKQRMQQRPNRGEGRRGNN